ncbi:MAG: SpoIID/LytB domain-containing protein, partial [Acidobacteriota bacterium]
MNSQTKKKRYFVILGICLFIFGWQPVDFGQDNSFFHGFLIKKPVIRVGLGMNLSDIRISASSGMKVYEVKTNYKLIAEDIDEVFIKGRKEKLSEKFLILVAQSEDRIEAESIAHELRTKIEQKVCVQKKEGGVEGLFQVVVGDFMTRGDALKYIKTLISLGMKEAWILTEDITAGESRPLWILVGEELKSLNDETVLYFIPSNSRSYLSFKGRSYRGIFVLKATSKGIVLVNILNIENYLKSVVPSELSPYTFRELEAQKAQAVAARTYALKNLGQNESFGFDLVDTPDSQYYQGMNVEHPLSSRAVEETKGETVLYKGKLIEALYTSTCGGQTENVEDVFQGPALPYLRSTECVYESQREWFLSSKRKLNPVYLDGTNLTPLIAELISLNLIPFWDDPLLYQEKAESDKALNWIDRSLSFLGKKSTNRGEMGKILTLGKLLPLIIEEFGWSQRVENLLLEEELSFILKDFPGWPEHLRPGLAYLVKTGIIPDSFQATGPDEPVLYGHLVQILWDMISDQHVFWEEGIFIKQEGDVLKVEKGDEEIHLSFSPDTFYFKNKEGRRTLVRHLYLLGGEKVHWIENDGELKLLEVFLPNSTNILDRSSSHHFWQVRITGKDLEARIN